MRNLIRFKYIYRVEQVEMIKNFSLIIFIRSKISKSRENH